MLTLIVILLIVWALLSIAGFIVKGLLWLAWVGLILFVITAVAAWIWRAIRSRS